MPPGPLPSSCRLICVAAASVVLGAPACDVGSVPAHGDATASAADAAASGDGEARDANGDAAQLAPPVTFGSLRDGTVWPFVAGDGCEIVQGPQGGIHLDAAVATGWRAGDGSIRVWLLARARDDGGDLIGLVEVRSYPLAERGDEPGVYASAPFAIFLASSDAADYAARPAHLDVRLIMPDGSERAAAVGVWLVDAQ